MPNFIGATGIHYTRDDGPCTGRKWCQRCKDIALSRLTVQAGLWWNLHTGRPATCPHCFGTACPGATNHNNPCTAADEDRKTPSWIPPATPNPYLP